MIQGAGCGYMLFRALTELFSMAWEFLKALDRDGTAPGSKI